MCFQKKYSLSLTIALPTLGKFQYSCLRRYSFSLARYPNCRRDSPTLLSLSPKGSILPLMLSGLVCCSTTRWCHHPAISPYLMLSTVRLNQLLSHQPQEVVHGSCFLDPYSLRWRAVREVTRKEFRWLLHQA